MTRHYYNEHDAYAAEWLRRLIDAGHLPAGDVDERSIVDVQPDDLRGYTSCHFFAGIGGWPLAARLAGWGDCRPLWTGSCPCQPFSSAGRREGGADDRHLWPVWARLVAACRPVAILGEQVASAVGHGWLDAVFADLEALHYTCGAVVLGAHSVCAPHRRQRLFWVGLADADAGGCAFSAPRLQRRRAASGGDDTAPGGADGARGDDVDGCGTGGGLGDADDGHESGRLDADAARPATTASGASPWADVVWLPCADGKARPIEPGLEPLVDGVSARVGRLRAYGNAIVPQVGAAFLAAVMEARS